MTDTPFSSSFRPHFTPREFAEWLSTMFAECGESQSAESLLSAVTAMRELPHDPNDPRFSGLLKVFMRIRGTQGK